MTDELDDFLADHRLCERCSKDTLCCEAFWQPCENCGGDGFDPWASDEEECDNGPPACDTCDGEGGWWWCDCDENGKHAKKEAMP